MSFVSITYLKNILFTLSYIESLLENFSLGFLCKCFRCSCKYFLNKYSCCSKATYNMQGFPNSIKGWGRGKNPPPPPPPDGGNQDFFGGGGFSTRCWKPEKDWFWPFEPFSKLITAFCEYWTSIKIKIIMTCIKE